MPGSGDSPRLSTPVPERCARRCPLPCHGGQGRGGRTVPSGGRTGAFPRQDAGRPRAEPPQEPSEGKEAAAPGGDPVRHRRPGAGGGRREGAISRRRSRPSALPPPELGQPRPARRLPPLSGGIFGTVRAAPGPATLLRDEPGPAGAAADAPVGQSCPGLEERKTCVWRAEEICVYKASAGSSGEPLGLLLAPQEPSLLKRFGKHHSC